MRFNGVGHQSTEMGERKDAGVVSTACALWMMGPQDCGMADTACGDVMQHKLMVGFKKFFFYSLG